MSYTQNHLNAIVINFVDMIAHSRSDNAILKEIAPDESCLLYTSDAADERSSVDLGGRRIIKKKN